jgi:hypothetical protein
MITETDEVARAIDEAARQWPGVGGGRARLLVLLVQEGYRCIREERRKDNELRRAGILQASGSLAGIYEHGYLDRLRAEWPQ